MAKTISKERKKTKQKLTASDTLIPAASLVILLMHQNREQGRRRGAAEGLPKTSVTKRNGAASTTQSALVHKGLLTSPLSF